MREMVHARAGAERDRPIGPVSRSGATSGILVVMGAEPHVAGHATHFLRRLDRVAEAHVERALALYRDHELLREVLARAQLPEGADRVALSLDDPNEGPFVLVTREGRFVTCLARGMKPYDVALVTKERIDAAASRVERMRERLERIRALDDEPGEVGKLYHRVQDCGPFLAREDVEALVTWEPLLSTQYAETAFGCEREVVGTFQYLATRRPDRMRRPDERLLHAWWRCFWTYQHLTPLLALRLVAEVVDTADAALHPGILSATSTNLLRFGVVATAARGIWAAARHPRTMLPVALGLPAIPTLVSRAKRDFSLAAIAHASSPRCAEAEVAIGVAATDFQSDDERDVEQFWQEMVIAELRGGLALSPKEALERFDLEARSQTFDWIQKGELETPIAIDRPEDIPLDVARAAFATNTSSFARDLNWLIDLAGGTPWLARCSLPELHLPRAWNRTFDEGYDRSVGLELVDGLRRIYGGGRTEPVRAQKTVGRNDPCPCGSGKKHKKCCG